MKRVFLIGLIVLMGFSCDKTMQVPERDVPEWLQMKIETSSTHDNLGAWIRYEYQKEIYYEYNNSVSSKFPDIYTKNGDSAFTSGINQWRDYLAKRCCARYIWRGRDHIEIF